MVLVHGFTGSAEAWGEELVEGLAEGGRDVVAIDLPGHGRTDGPYTLDEAVRRILDAVPGSFDLVGYSMGGRIALHAAVRAPGRIRRLVLESASPGLADEGERAVRREADEVLAREIERDGVPRFAERWADTPVLAPAPGRPPEAHERQRTVRQGHSAAGLAGALRGLGTGALPSLWGRLGEVSADTLLLVGAADGKFVQIAREMSPLFASARIEIVEEAGHTVHADRPEAWLAAVVTHLSTGP